MGGGTWGFSPEGGRVYTAAVIKSAHITGYKCLRDVRVRLAPFTVIIGPNDSGKSSFLRALSLPWSPNSPIPPTEGAVVVSSDTASAAVSWRPKLGFRFDFQSAKGPLDEGRVRAAQGDPQSPAYAPLPEELHGPRTAGPLVLDASKVPRSASIQGVSLDTIVQHQGYGVAAQMARLALSDRRGLDTIQGEMNRVTGGRVADCVINDNGQGSYSLSFRLYDGTVIPGEDLSAGLLMYLGFLTILHRGDAPGVLLVEEPENGLHPLRLHEVVGVLRKLTERGVQVICTTHSPDLLSACDPAEVRVFLRPRPGDATEVHELPPDFTRIAMRSSLGEVWASRGEEGLLDMLPKVDPQVRAEAP